MNENVKNIINYINENLYNNIKISDIENEFHYNKHYIMRLFKKETGLTITDYMNQVKILNSLSQLSKTNDLILKVALDNGFNSQEYYCEIFYKVMNQTPSNYRKISQNIKSTKINELKDIKEEILRIKDYKVLTLEILNGYENNVKLHYYSNNV